MLFFIVYRCVTNSSHSELHSLNPYRPLHLHKILITPKIIKHIVFVCKFTKDIKFCIEFGFSLKDYCSRQTLFRCCSFYDQYCVTNLVSPSVYYNQSVCMCWGMKSFPTWSTYITMEHLGLMGHVTKELIN